ncbi:hypothetical protein O1M54_26530 [Streptomyces diastatochromogenes]|nr:hypothetical protein [Streptomyces diastatochromogenes]
MASFQWACHAAARTARLRVRALDTGVAASYHAVDIGGTAVLAHGTLPVVAFAAGPVVPAGPVLAAPDARRADVQRVGLRALTGRRTPAGTPPPRP